MTNEQEIIDFLNGEIYYLKQVLDPEIKHYHELLDSEPNQFHDIITQQFILIVKEKLADELALNLGLDAETIGIVLDSYDIRYLILN